MSKKSINFFDILTNINSGSSAEDLLCDSTATPSEATVSENEKAYNSFMINRGLSFFQDSILFANEMNIHHDLPAKMAYDFYRNSLRPRKRFSKWFKALPDSDDIELIKRRYGYSSAKARDVLHLYSDDDLKALRESMNVGGKY
jgi:hypothetical protein